MNQKSKEKPSKRILFSEEVDSAINGYAVGFLFIVIGAFLLMEPNYFAEPIITYIIGAIIGLFGVMGTGVELSKSSKIHGIDKISIGAALFVGWLAQYVYISAIWANILFFVLLILGVYSILLGVFQAVYSLVYNARRRNELVGDAQTKEFSVGKFISQVVLFLTQLCGLGIAVLNVLKASGIKSA